MIIAIIPAKGGSKRLPNKNMYPLLGKPMLYYAINYAKQSKLISEIYVSTDDKIIAEFAKQEVVKVINRPNSLGGDIPLIDVYRHALQSLQLENVRIVVGVQPDHPDRNISIDESLNKFKAESLDFLYSIDGEGGKNGAHSVMLAENILSGQFNNKSFIIDDCTNIHYLEDIKLAEKKLK